MGFDAKVLSGKKHVTDGLTESKPNGDDVGQIFSRIGLFMFDINEKFKQSVSVDDAERRD